MPAASHAQTFPTTHAFLKLQPPQVMAPDEPNPPEEKSVEWMKYWLFRTSDLRFIPDPRLVDYVAEYKRCKRKESVPWKNTEDFLEILFPIRYWTENGARYKQPVSTEQVTRDELKLMAQIADEQLEYRQSKKEVGYCPIRFGLHMELFDELIRQVALTCTMRAYMLERTRGELYQTLDAYRKILDVSLIEEIKSDAEDKVDPEYAMLQKKLEDAQAELETAEEDHAITISDFNELDNKLELFERIQKQVHEPEIAFMKKLNEAAERQLWHFENPPSFENEEDD